MKINSTPGPWNYDFNPLSSVSPNGQFNIKAGEVGTPICMMPMPLGGINPKEKQEANAMLISAAPDMLKVLDEFIEGTDSGKFVLSAPNEDHEASIIIRMMKAIQKATDKYPTE